LSAAGFSNVRVQRETANSENEVGRVLAQPPSPGSAVSPDDAVTLVVGQSPGG